jgi:hypothetical protein
MNRDLLRAIGEALYGEPWKSPLARDLETHVRNLRRWESGEFTTPDDLRGILIRLVKRRIARLTDLLARLER